MFRILLFVFIAFLCWLAIRMLGGSRKRGDPPRQDPSRDAAPPAARRVETVTQCAWCGVHVPPTEAVTLPDGRVYCSDAHRDAARQVATPSDKSRT